MLIRKAYRYRLYPNATQSEALAKNFGCARFLYNHFLAIRKQYYVEHKDDRKKRGLSYFDTTSQLKNLKRAPEYIWLKEAQSQVLQQSLKDLDRAYQNFFASGLRFPVSQQRTDGSLFAIRKESSRRKLGQLPKIARSGRHPPGQ